MNRCFLRKSCLEIGRMQASAARKGNYVLADSTRLKIHLYVEEYKGLENRSRVDLCSYYLIHFSTAHVIT